MNELKQRFIERKIAKELNKPGDGIQIDKSSCDGCGNCVEVCPQSAISIKILSHEEIKALSFKGRMKVRFKGIGKAEINTDLCISCYLCLKQCHEVAIKKQY